MPQRAETTKEIFEEERKKSWKGVGLKPIWNRWSLLLSILLSVIAGGLAGYLGGVYYINYQEPSSLTTNTNASIIDFTKKITIDDPGTEVIKRLTQQIVGVYKVKKSNFWWQKLYLENEFLGTGLVVTSDGWIMTSDEVIKDFNQEYQIMTANNNFFLTKNFVQDDLTGIVFFKIEADNLLPIQFADLDYLVPAQETIVIAANGTPGDAKIKVSSLEKLRYYLQESNKDYFHSTEEQDEYLLLRDKLPSNFIGCLAANLYGQVIGIGQIVAQGNEFQTLIPASYLEQAVKSFLVNQEKVARNYMGLNYINLSQNPNLPSNLTANLTKGVLLISSNDLYITAIKNDSPLKEILEEEDIILQINGEEINEKNNLTKLFQDYSGGDKLRMLILRTGEEIEVEFII